MGRKPVHLVFVEGRSTGNDNVDHNKFYDMLEVNGECHCYWGRAKDDYEFGKSGKLSVYPMSQWDSIFRAKVGKGYTDMSHLRMEAVVATPVGGSASSDTYATIPNRQIATIVERLQAYAKEVIRTNYSVSSAQVTKAMVDDVQEILDRMMQAQSDLDFGRCVVHILKVIPRTIRNVDDYVNECVSNRARTLQKEQDLLDIMRGQIITPVRGQKVETVAGDKKTILELNGIEMSEVTADDIAIIKRKLEGNANRLKAAWRITNLKQKKAYDSYLADNNIGRRDTRLLWHGTRNENVWSIMKSGLILRPTNAVITGKMFGYGIYFAPLAQKSLGYTSLSGSYWARGNSNSGFMLLHEVAYGKPYDVYSFESRLQNFDYRKLRAAAPDANCLHAHSGQGMLRNDEIVVYKEEQLSPLFLVELT